jgi:hypothetical protein
MAPHWKVRVVLQVKQCLTDIGLREYIKAHEPDVVEIHAEWVE